MHATTRIRPNVPGENSSTQNNWKKPSITLIMANDENELFWVSGSLTTPLNVPPQQAAVCIMRAVWI